MGAIGRPYLNRRVVVVLPVETLLFHLRGLVVVARPYEVAGDSPGPLGPRFEGGGRLILLLASILHEGEPGHFLLVMGVPGHHFGAVLEIVLCPLCLLLLRLEPFLSSVEGRLVNVDLPQILDVPFYPLGHIADIVSVNVVERDVGSLYFCALGMEAFLVGVEGSGWFVFWFGVGGLEIVLAGARVGVIVSVPSLGVGKVADLGVASLLEGVEFVFVPFYLHQALLSDLLLVPLVQILCLFGFDPGLPEYFVPGLPQLLFLQLLLVFIEVGSWPGGCLPIFWFLLIGKTSGAEAIIPIVK